MIRERRLEPAESQIGELATRPHRLFTSVVVLDVEHEVDAVSGVFAAHRACEREVPRRVAPGVEFDRAKPAVQALRDEVEIGGHVGEKRRTRVCRKVIPGAAE